MRMLCTALLILAFAATAQAEIVKVTVEATGADPQEATNNALVEAVRRVNGVSISANQLMETTTTTDMRSSEEGNASEFRSVTRQGGAVGAKSAGHLAGYQVLESGASEYGYRVVLEARIYRYRAPGIASDNRRKLAVIPFGARAERMEFFGPQAAHELAHELSQAVVGHFVQSRRFAILDRESWGAIGAEQALFASSSTPISEKAKLGRTLGADYLVLGELLEADAGVQHGVQRLTGVRTRQASASISLAYRIVVPATGEIKFADTLSLSINDSQGRPLGSRTEALGELSKQLVGIALDRIYPMQVVSVPGPASVVLNQGGSTLAVGDRLRLTAQGEALVDPYTKEPLGRVETPVGLLQVTRVDGKLAYADVIESSGALQTGLLARRELALYGAGAQPQVAAPSPRTEGVRLPFDR